MTDNLIDADGASDVLDPRVRPTAPGALTVGLSVTRDTA
jgi:hypothetical protein